MSSPLITSSGILFLQISSLIISVTTSGNIYGNSNTGLLQSSAANSDLQLNRLFLRLDQFDLKLSRLQNLLQVKFDHIEKSITATSVRLDLLTSNLNRVIDDAIGRKLKPLETKMVSIEGKLSMMQRENHRFQDFVVDMVNNLGASSSSGVNQQRQPPPPPPPPQTSSSQNLTALSLLMKNATLEAMKFILRNSSSDHLLLPSKVTNMFEDLTKRSSNLEGLVGRVANATRKDFIDGVRTIIALIQEKQEKNEHRSVTSSEAISTILLETFQTMESHSTTILSRKLTELSRGIEEKLEMVSMAINSFGEECKRIQDNEETIEDRIAEILGKILDMLEDLRKEKLEKETIKLEPLEKLEEEDLEKKHPTPPPDNEDVHVHEKTDLELILEAEEAAGNNNTLLFPWDVDNDNEESDITDIVPE